ncbi:putative transmembrane protein [Rhodopirellula islandica]|uniref:Transmembrane protein n=2 Tax=Rhodopirellula islandica TaxID=595434 RepID=A0A0J1BDR2_RHOIS|nr:putative transmembrane protein [Rhodopirellula islandica]
MMQLAHPHDHKSLMSTVVIGRSSGFSIRLLGKRVLLPEAIAPVMLCIAMCSAFAINADSLRAGQPLAFDSAVFSQPLSLSSASEWTSTETIAAEEAAELNRVEAIEIQAENELDLSDSLTSIHSASVTRPHPNLIPSGSFMVPAPSSLQQDLTSDRYWLISTRHITSTACRANLQNPNLHISRLNRCGQSSPSSLDEYIATFDPSRPRVIYVHGNRRSAPLAIQRGMDVARELEANRCDRTPMDFVIWSWQSDRETFAITDARIKAERTDAQGLYLAWLLHRHVEAAQPTALIGFSFGGRIVTGSLHALAGGSIGRRSLSEAPVMAANLDVGLLAPAIQSDWLMPHGYHRLATQNMNRLVLLYNQRDAILKNYWLLTRIRGTRALGYTGPTRFAPRYDGSPLPVRSRDCSPTVGKAHSEEEYYKRSCYAGREMASLLSSSLKND